VINAVAIRSFVSPSILINHKERLVIIGVPNGVPTRESEVDITSEPFVYACQRTHLSYCILNDTVNGNISEPHIEVGLAVGTDRGCAIA
jgi:hypothetical protein